MLEIPEVKMLIDGIAANVSLSADQKEKLIEKLLGTLSIHQAKDLRKGVVYYDTAGNEQFYYNIEDLETVWNRWFNERTIDQDYWIEKSPNYYMEESK